MLPVFAGARTRATDPSNTTIATWPGSWARRWSAPPAPTPSSGAMPPDHPPTRPALALVGQVPNRALGKASQILDLRLIGVSSPGSRRCSLFGVLERGAAFCSPRLRWGVGDLSGRWWSDGLLPCHGTADFTDGESPVLLSSPWDADRCPGLGAAARVSRSVVVAWPGRRWCSQLSCRPGPGRWRLRPRGGGGSKRRRRARRGAGASGVVSPLHRRSRNLGTPLDRYASGPCLRLTLPPRYSVCYGRLEVAAACVVRPAPALGVLGKCRGRTLGVSEGGGVPRLNAERLITTPRPRRPLGQ